MDSDKQIDRGFDLIYLEYIREVRILKQYVRYLIIWGINSGVILLANKLYPSNFVLGNAVVPPIYAALLAGFLLTVFDKAIKPLVKKLVPEKRGRYVMFGIYWLVNFVGIWLLARVSFISGFGISAFYFAIILGLAVCIAQWLGRQFFKVIKFL